MTASAPLIEKLITLTFGGTSFAEDVIDARIEPTPGDVKTVITLDGVAHQDVGTPTWDLVLNMIIDHDSGRPGLAYYLNNNIGSSVAVVFNPHGTGAESASQPKWTFNVRIQPAQIGGDGNEYAEYEVRLPITGTPTRDGTP